MSDDSVDLRRELTAAELTSLNEDRAWFGLLPLDPPVQVEPDLYARAATPVNPVPPGGDLSLDFGTDAQGEPVMFTKDANFSRVRTFLDFKPLHWTRCDGGEFRLLDDDERKAWSAYLTSPKRTPDAARARRGLDALPVAEPDPIAASGAMRALADFGQEQEGEQLTALHDGSDPDWQPAPGEMVCMLGGVAIRPDDTILLMSNPEVSGMRRACDVIEPQPYEPDPIASYTARREAKADRVAAEALPDLTDEQWEAIAAVAVGQMRMQLAMKGAGAADAIEDDDDLPTLPATALRTWEG